MFKTQLANVGRTYTYLSSKYVKYFVVLDKVN